MPLYEFRCSTCGSFEQWRSLAQASEPMACPNCKLAAKRIYSVAGLLTTPSALRQRIEQSAEPKVATKGDRHPHATSHQHNHQQGRPWMIGH